MELKKAVNIPINAISATSKTHLKEKLDTLVGLLTGKQITIGNKRVSATEHPAALALCKDLFANKIVVRINKYNYLTYTYINQCCIDFDFLFDTI